MLAAAGQATDAQRSTDPDGSLEEGAKAGPARGGKNRPGPGRALQPVIRNDFIRREAFLACDMKIRTFWPAALLELQPYPRSDKRVIARPVGWVGTSLGGICGMVIAAAGNSPIRRMVLNDIGPFVPREAIARIIDYVGHVPEFADEAEVETYLRRIHAPFGRLTDAQWAAMAQHGARRLPNGGLTLHYDPALAEPLRAAPAEDTKMWQFWDRITAPMLTLRGIDSDLLSTETLARMQSKSATHIVEDAGHAPAMMDAPTIAVVERFLAGEV